MISKKQEIGRSKRFNIGTKVRYYPCLLFKERFIESEVLSEIWNLCGSKVLKIKVVVGGVDVEHLELI